MSCGCHNTAPRDPGDDRCEEGHRFVRCDHGYCACNGGPSVVLGRGSRYWEAKEKNMAIKANVYDDDAEQTIVFKLGDRRYTVKGYVIRAEVSGFNPGREVTLELCGTVTSEMVHRTPHFQPDLVASRHTHGERCICRCSACLKDGKCICGECTCR